MPNRNKHSTKSDDCAGLPRTGLEFGVAESVDQVIAAWQLVHNRYVDEGLINSNETRLHTVRQAVSPDTSVIIGTLSDQVVSTLTIMHDDDEHGLPLDTVYGNELNTLRRNGRRLLEVGLLADRRVKMSRFISALFQLIRYPYFNAKFSGRDMLAGVHPHHAGFYERSMGFEPWGPVRQYPRVNNQPVLLLRVNIDQVLKQDKLPKATAIYEANPLPQEVFDHRYRFDPSTLTGSDIESFFRLNSGNEHPLTAA